jgi:hypothetical protein
VFADPSNLSLQKLCPEEYGKKWGKPHNPSLVSDFSEKVSNQ